MKHRPFVLAVLAAFCSCRMLPTDREVERVVMPLELSDTALKQTILQHTPIGTSAVDVASFVNQRLQHAGGLAPYYSEDSDEVIHQNLIRPDGPPSAGWKYYYSEVPDLRPVLEKLPPGKTGRLDVWFGSGVYCEWEFDRDARLVKVQVFKRSK